MDAHYGAVEEALRADAALPGAPRETLHRRDRNHLPAALWAFAAVPWVPELTLDGAEWDVMWRLTFGGVTREMRDRLDPVDGFAFRGRRMEFAVMDAIEECVPAGLVKVWSQPAPERLPLDHADRCARAGCSPDGWKRADIALEFVTGKTVVLDVRTTNTLSASAGGPAAHLRALEAAKTVKYQGYYRKFMPFVIDLGGAVSMRSIGALKLIAKLAADAARPRLPWEAFEWSTHMQRRIAVAMVRCTAWIATREPAREAVPGSRAGLARLDCASRSPAPADSPATG